MKWTSLNDLREKYLSFFESKGHLRLPSFPLVPINDNSLLLINSGMAPMKKYFTGEEKPPRTRVTTCQKCIRTPDLECVGKTARHGTYFEMLGNFSFGDYFKDEAIPWAWEFLTKCLEIPEEKLWPSVYVEDDEAYDIWLNKIGVPADRIVKLGKEDNFWEHGTGPCGPCSEIYYDRGEKYGCGSPDCKPGCECDRYMEIWNNVFSQFNNMGDGTYTELKQKNIDTGMGLERLACIFQDVDNLFEVDTIKNILNHLAKIAGIEYKKDAKKDVSMRVITDHIRSTTFMISDGVMPSNEGRGYVLRRLLRRAARHGKLLNINRPFLSELCDTVINENKNAYPELVEKQEFIKKVISVEEENFSKTIDQGIKMLNDITENNNSGIISGEDAFKLYDTYGFPLDITCDIAQEKGFKVDEEKFRELMTLQRERARSSRKEADTNAWKGSNDPLKDFGATEFLGYENDECQSNIIAIVNDGMCVDNAKIGDKVVLVCDKTCFYAQSGGQVGDTGIITGSSFKANIVDTLKNAHGVFMHSAEITEGVVSVGDTAALKIDVDRRMAIRRNHTAAHLLQAALRKILGTHVEQAGQLVNENAVRFDFTHFSALSDDELKEVENTVNSVVLNGATVENPEMPIEKAKAMGAMALFGEKYSDVVRVVKAGDFSIELCGGTHVDNTSKIGLFKIISESSVAAGVRRIEAVTGTGVLELIDEYTSIIKSTCESVKVGNFHDLTSKVKSVVGEVKALEKKIETIEAKTANDKLSSYLNSAVDVDGIKVVSTLTNGVNSDGLKMMCETFKTSYPSAVAIFASNENGKIIFACACGAEAVKRGANAGSIVREVAKITGGNGGGRPDTAMAGGKDASKIDEAVNTGCEIVKSMLK